jgi:hypothetical protein
MTTLSLNLPPELEQCLYNEASQQGVEPTHLIMELLQQQLRPNLSQATDSELLAQTNLGLSQRTWEHYHCLIAKRREESLSNSEQAELIAISEQIEQANAQRIKALIVLADRQNVTLEQIMQDLEIESPRCL